MHLTGDTHGVSDVVLAALCRREHRGHAAPGIGRLRRRRGPGRRAYGHRRREPRLKLGLGHCRADPGRGDGARLRVPRRHDRRARRRWTDLHASGGGARRGDRRRASSRRRPHPWLLPLLPRPRARQAPPGRRDRALAAGVRHREARPGARDHPGPGLRAHPGEPGLPGHRADAPRLRGRHPRRQQQGAPGLGR